MNLTNRIQRERRHRTWTGLVCSFIALRCGVTPLQADGQFRLFTRPLEIPERGTVTSYVLQSAEGEFQFLPPSNWVVQENAATRSVVVMARDLTTSISFRIVEAGSEWEGQADTNRWRNAISEKFPEARILAEFRCYTGSGEGSAFDLERKAANKSKVRTRFAFVPLEAGTVEFNLTAAAGDFDNLQWVFGNMLTSFHARPGRTGKPDATTAKKTHE